jgi:hypothetical protein
MARDAHDAHVEPTRDSEGAIHGHRKGRQPLSFGAVATSVLLIFIIVVSQRFYVIPLRCSDLPALSSFSSSAYPLSFSALQQEPVHPLLLHPTVAISFHWNASLLGHLEYLLSEIRTWKSPHVDVCIGTNEPERLRNYMSRSMNRLNATGNVHACPIALPLDKDYMLNWRTREVLGQKFNDTQANYTSFVFLEVCHHMPAAPAVMRRPLVALRGARACCGQRYTKSRVQCNLLPPCLVARTFTTCLVFICCRRSAAPPIYWVTSE